MTTPTMYRYCTKEDDGLTEELIVLALQGIKFMHVFFYSLYCVCSANSGPLDNNTIEGIATNLGWNVPNKFMTKCCSYYGVNESVHFNNVWEMSVQISLEVNDLHTY